MSSGLSLREKRRKSIDNHHSPQLQVLRAAARQERMETERALMSIDFDQTAELERDKLAAARRARKTSQSKKTLELVDETVLRSVTVVRAEQMVR
jgi:hypothetical protein